MPLPKLSPLQSRVAASLGASVCLLLLYLAFASPHFAYATDVNSIRPEDHNHELLRGGRPFLDFELESDLELRGLSYEPEFLGVDRGIIGRAPTSNEPIPLINNVRQADNVPMGSTVSYIFTNASVWGSKSTAPLSPAMVRRQLLVNGDSVQETSDEDLESPVVGDLRSRQNAAISNRTVYITVTTCDQPQPIEPDGGYSPAPQLQVYVSVSEDNKSPGPNKSPQNMTELDRGFGSIEVNATSNVYIGIYGKNATAYQGVWNAEIAVSIDAPYHYYHDNENMLFVDSDSTSAYLTADDPSIYNGAVSDDESLSRASKPYVLFASSSVKNVSAIYGLQNSACGLATKAQFMPEGTRPGQVVSNVRTWLSMKRDVVVPEQMFAINGLQSGTTYDAVLAIPRDPNNIGTVGGGGQVFRRLSFTTLSDSNCAVVTNLTFCEGITYSVPSNPRLFPNETSLRDVYDNYTIANFKYFENAMMQIPCNTTSSAQYSLATGCDNCTRAYKDWFCAVSLPRCTDFTRQEDYLQVRNVGSPSWNGSLLPTDTPLFKLANSTAAGRSSRNPMIDTTIQPGPYKELLPCDDLCYNVVRNCPAAIGFTCPLPGYIGFNTSYAQRFNMSIDRAADIYPPQCNFPGAIKTSASNRVLPLSLFCVFSTWLLALMFI